LILINTLKKVINGEKEIPFRQPTPVRPRGQALVAPAIGVLVHHHRRLGLADCGQPFFVNAFIAAIFRQFWLRPKNKVKMLKF
jgi:hypothetical protein